MTAIRNFNEEIYIELPSKQLAPQLFEVAKKAGEVSEEYMNMIVKDVGDLEKAVELFVAIGLGITLLPKQALLKDCYEHAVKFGKKAAKLEMIAKNLDLLPEHIVRLTTEQAEEFGL